MLIFRPSVLLFGEDLAQILRKKLQLLAIFGQISPVFIEKSPVFSFAHPFFH